MYQVTQEDKDIAIGMWESIRDDWLKNPWVPLITYKHTFLSKFGYANKWTSDCLLCEFYSYYEDGIPYPYSACKQCPLGNCAERSAAYYRVWCWELPLQDRIDACNEIIKCIEDIEVEK